MRTTLRFVGFLAAHLPRWAGQALVRTLRALLHRWTYKGPTDAPKVVLVVGGSFAGYRLVARLCDTLPTGWQVVLVDQNRHFNWSFALPRCAVVPGHERTAFLTYATMLARGGAASASGSGVARFVQGRAVAVTAAKTVLLDSGAAVAYDILVVATGSAQLPPAKLRGAADKTAACRELQELQARIRRARTVAVVGGGAVGLELATDIKTFAGVVAARHRAAHVGKDQDQDQDQDKDKDDDAVADKHVTLVHARPQLLNRFGRRLHEHVMGVLATQGITVELGQRAAIAYRRGGGEGATADVAGAPGTLTFADGRALDYDCILLCTGQTPNAALLQDVYAGALAPSGDVRVNAGLQVVTTGEGTTDETIVPDMFALGDVAATGGPKMARAGFVQADVVADNIMETIRGRAARHRYEPSVLESALKLTLGKDATVMYMDWDKAANESILLSTGGDPEGMHAERQWRIMGVTYEDDE